MDGMDGTLPMNLDQEWALWQSWLAYDPSTPGIYDEVAAMMASRQTRVRPISLGGLFVAAGACVGGAP